MPRNGIISEVSEGIATVTFYHPKANSLPGHLLQELAEAIKKISKNKKADIVILKSAGQGAFCGGASFDELVEIANPEQGKQFFMGFASVINAMRTCPQLIIARVQGKTVGGGVGLAAAADHALAHQSADVKLSELSLGIGPFVVGPVVRRKIGDSGFSMLAIDATSWYDAKWARENGLYAKIYKTHEDLDAGVEELAMNLSQSNPEAMQELKKILWRGTDHWDTLLEQRAEISGRLVLSEHTQNFIKKFSQYH